MSKGPKIAHGPNLLKVKEAAELLNVSPKTIYALKDRGELKYHLIGGAIRISTADLEHFLQSTSKGGWRTQKVA